MTLVPYVLAIALGYFLGAIPVGYLAGLYFAKIDVREIGSGRTGTSNVFRSAGRTAGFVTIFGDVFKGTLAVILARLIWGANPEIVHMTAALAAIFSVIGHNHSIFLGFKGGAGTLTAAGAMLGLDPFVTVLMAIIPISFAYITRITSIGSLLASSIALLLGGVLIWQTYMPWENILLLLPFFFLSWQTHQPNIARLRAGNERRFGEKAKR